MHLVVTVKSAKEPNTRKELALDMEGLAYSSQSPYLVACSTVTSSASKPQQKSATTERTPDQAMQILVFGVKHENRRHSHSACIVL